MSDQIEIEGRIARVQIACRDGLVDGLAIHLATLTILLDRGLTTPSEAVERIRAAHSSLRAGEVPPPQSPLIETVVRFLETGGSQTDVRWTPEVVGGRDHQPDE